MTFLEGLGGFVKGIFKTIFSKSGLMGFLGWRWFIFITIMIISVGSSISESIKQHDATIFVKDIGSKLFSTDQAIENEANRVIADQSTFSIFDWIWSYFVIMSNIYTIYFWYYIGFKIVGFFTDQSSPILTKMFWSTMFIMVIRASYIVVMTSIGILSFETDFGGNVFRLILPYYGIWLVIKNINLWLSPLSSIMN